MAAAAMMMTTTTTTMMMMMMMMMYVGRTESHEQLFVACNLGTADEREYGGRWNQLLC
jgi:hypothetical protein